MAASFSMSALDIDKFNKLKAIIGKSNSERVNEIDINVHGMTDLKTKKAEDVERKKKQKKEWGNFARKSGTMTTIITSQTAQL